MKDRLDAIAALRDIADHLDRNPHLAVPMDIRPWNGQIQVQVTTLEFQAWRNTATHIHHERIDPTGTGYHAHSALVVGRTAFELVCVELDDMTRQAFALLVGFGYQTPTIAKAV